MRLLRRIYLLIAVCLAVSVAILPSFGATPKKSTSAKTTSRTTGKTTGKNSAKKTSGKKKSSNTSSSKKKATTKPKETSSDVKKKEAAAQKEITATKQKIAANDKEVAAGISLLNELDLSIKSSEKKVADLTEQLSSLDRRIAEVSGNIGVREKRVAELRTKYIEAVKKMRLSQRQPSTAGFIFSSKNFYQAYRRMRYLKKFSDWRRRQTEQIRKEIRELDASKRELADLRTSQDAVLKQQVRAKEQLASQHSKQRATVAKLKADGDALRSYLARKQSEANQLQNRMTQLIAAEQAAAAEAQRRKEEQARLEAERKAREAKQAEERRLAEEKRAREKREAEEAARKAELAKKNQKPAEKDPATNPTAEKETKKKEEPSKSYAEARGRTSRNTQTPSAPAKTTPATSATSSTGTSSAAASGFAGMKGKLPRPVAGSFAVVNAFGKHPLPDLPDVMYDNPGIDALVKKGEHAKAVYDGTVSGVYMINGFGNVVLVNHGDYFTVYGNLASTAVTKGQSVKQGQDLGSVAVDPDDNNRSTIHFEVWKGRTKLNPSEWIR